jgi:hypothetical protein
MESNILIKKIILSNFFFMVSSSEMNQPLIICFGTNSDGCQVILLVYLFSDKNVRTTKNLSILVCQLI